MSKPKHAPGPSDWLKQGWTVGQYYPEDAIPYLKARQRLEDAAPELLAALKFACICIPEIFQETEGCDHSDCSYHDVNALLDDLKAVIEKAEGKL
jgi:hypothetical protein